MRRRFKKKSIVRIRLFCLVLSLLFVATLEGTPKVILISLDGATPRLIQQYQDNGALSKTEGLALLEKNGIKASRNVTISPSLTSAGHIAIATGSTTPATNINSNSFQLVASPFNSTVSGFGAPVGGYRIDGPAISPMPTAELLWNPLREKGKVVVTATWPAADGVDIRVPGLISSPIVQSSKKRTVDYTVPFGVFAGIGARGFSLTSADFGLAPQTTVDELVAAGKIFFGLVQQKTTNLDTFAIDDVTYNIQLAAFDSTNDSTVNYDTVVFFDEIQRIRPGPFSLPSTGPAYVRVADKVSSPFYLEGSSSKAGIAFYVSFLSPDLSTVRLARYAANAIPRSSTVPEVLDNIEDANTHAGFWRSQGDFRILERIGPGFTNFPEEETEAMFEDQVRTFIDYQTRVALRAIEQNPDADLVMIYLEEPDGSEHQFLLTDSRQATNSADPKSIGSNQDQNKMNRYRSYVQTAYEVANQAVQRIFDAVGINQNGIPNSNILVVSDHGFDIFHTAVDVNALLAANGIDSTKVRAVVSGPVVNVYINLEGREPDGTVSRSEYIFLQEQVSSLFKDLQDSNSNYTLGSNPVSIFDNVYKRPLPSKINDPSFGRGTNEFIGQDAGDVLGILTVGYNFEGIQTPVVIRLGDSDQVKPIVSVPNFCGAHGYDPSLQNLSAIFYAAGPDIRKGLLHKIRDIDIAPTVNALLNSKSASTVQGKILPIRIPRKLNLAVLAELNEILPTGNKETDSHLRKATMNLKPSLSSNFWKDDSRLTSRGEKVFHEEKKAARELMKIVNPSPEITEILLALVGVDLTLAEILIEDLRVSGVPEAKLAKALQHLNQGRVEESQGKHDDAIDSYGDAWKAAAKILKP